MKKVSILLAVLALCMQTAFAQNDKMLFNHLSVGVTAGIDGLGLELALPASPSWQIRGGYALLPFTYRKDLNLGKLTIKEISDTEFDLTHVPFSLSVWKGGTGHLLADYFPGRTAFRITAGAFAGPGTLAVGQLDARSFIEPKDYKTSAGIRGFHASTDENGFINLDARVWKVLPYLGIGFGRAMPSGKPVSFTFDLGVAYTGGIRLNVYDYSNPSKVQTCEVHSTDLVLADGTQLDKGIVDKVCGIPVLPMMRIGLHIRLF